MFSDGEGQDEVWRGKRDERLANEKVEPQSTAQELAHWKKLGVVWWSQTILVKRGVGMMLMEVGKTMLAKKMLMGVGGKKW